MALVFLVALANSQQLFHVDILFYRLSDVKCASLNLFHLLKIEISLPMKLSGLLRMSRDSSDLCFNMAYPAVYLCTVFNKSDKELWI